MGHCVTQVYFDGRWNLFDGDMHSMYLLRDNQTVAGEQDLVRDHDLVRRTHTQGILNPTTGDRRVGGLHLRLRGGGHRGPQRGPARP